MFCFNLGLFSKYRAELMGVATLMIIICHSPIYVTMPGWLAIILGNGGTGCDVFLFLSGMGMYNSYMNHRTRGLSIPSWYWKRYVRIVIPCAFFILGLEIYKGDMSGLNVINLVINLAGFLYLTGNLALWFVACVLLLYLLTPIIHRLLTGENKWVWLAILCFLSLLFWYVDFGDSSLVHNWQFCISRFPSYFIGYTLALSIKEKKESNVFVFILVPLLLYTVFFVLNHTVGTNFSLFWTQGIPIASVCALILDRIHSESLCQFLSFMGGISLESYATNVLVLPHFLFLKSYICGISVNFDGVIFYISGTVICLVISVLVNRACKFIISKL